MPVEYPINKKVLQSAPIGGHPQATPRRVSLEREIVTVYDPEGNPHQCMRQVANDRVKILGWSWGSREEGAPESQADDPVERVDEVAVEVEAEAEAAAKEPNETELALAYLESLREEAESLGVKVDARWGKRRLTAEITKAKE